MQYNKIAGGFASFPPPMIQGLSSAQIIDLSSELIELVSADMKRDVRHVAE